ncbi:putative Sensor histidine kinase/response regulator [Taphrina deformans PYCC 5710]|uniref:histidine kinase n=1 Tax=Taphrina deformans (strain PYCC 5710 / ATCC 11124 / CBS 356.35 / IMI 108563 / JCM 9778 / NBRC 8474) TaxID=1097556 RepID=R4XCB7_TAPDE|nr:putative Sensor histidine kinase/response regulator [Taphrina deformans PYCC 5710]|eukprot:CCG80970.1 putative Sensor histidine kinase/response regulator [Taphrina deformans PYCC 5710]
MGARRIATHRYHDHENRPLSVTNAQIELAAEYRNLLVADSESSVRYGRYVRLIPTLLECQTAHLLFVLDKHAKEIVSCGTPKGGLPISFSFGEILAQRDSAAVGNVKQEHPTVNAGVIASYICAPIIISGLRLCLLLATDDKVREWASGEVEQLQDVAQMLVSNLEVTRERHLISVQRRMQRSLVQFVRGNLSTVDNEAYNGKGAKHTGSLYSDLDEDLEAEDAEDETEQVETSKMNVMFDFSAKLIRRTLKVSGCVLINIENLTELENIKADFPARSTIMGACFLKHLRTADWHEKHSENSMSTRDSTSIGSDEAMLQELQTRNVPRDDTFDARGLSAPWLKQFLEDHPRAITFNETSLPEALKILLPAGVQSCLVSPIYDSNAKAFALIVVFDDKHGEFTKADAHYVEAFGSSIYAEVLNQSLQKANDAKSLFISKVSHEFRTPLHGVLASAEFLNDMAETTPAQLGFIQTIDMCGRTLLDIINHVLDYSKLSFSKDVLAVESGSPSITYEDFDVVEVAEQVLSTAFSSYEFKRINDHVDVQKADSQQSRSDSDSGSMWEALGRNLEVLVMADYRPQGYIINSDLGAFRRIVLNLLGNALKYTSSGHVTLELKLIPTDADGLEELEIIISDTGIGIAKSFLIEMFRPFTQEDHFSAGTGLGLSIVKELCNKLHGTIDVVSKKKKGSRFFVSYPVVLKKAAVTLFHGAGVRRDLEKIKFHYLHSEDSDGEASLANDVVATDLLRRCTIGHLKHWYNMEDVSLEEAEILVTDDNGYAKNRSTVLGFTGPILTLCSTTAKYEKTKRRHSSALQVFVTKPCGPIRLGQTLMDCLTKARNLARMNTNLSRLQAPSISGVCEDMTVHDTWQPSPPPSVSSNVLLEDPSETRYNITGGTRRTIKEEQKEQNLAEMFNMMTMGKISRGLSRSGTINESSRMGEAESSLPEHAEEFTSRETPLSPPPAPQRENSVESSHTADFDTRKRHCLIVEDNPINMMLLVAFAKQRNITVTTAVNGALAFERVKERPRSYDAILMDINMPVMNGFQSIEAIRKYERENEQTPAKIVALTGLSTPEDQKLARDLGADAFFTKPVKMRDLAELFVEWKVLPAVERSVSSDSASSVTAKPAS